MKSQTNYYSLAEVARLEGINYRSMYAWWMRRDRRPEADAWFRSMEGPDVALFLPSTVELMRRLRRDNWKGEEAELKAYLEEPIPEQPVNVENAVRFVELFERLDSLTKFVKALTPEELAAVRERVAKKEAANGQPNNVEQS